MPSGRYTRIEITHEAYMGLEAEAVLQGVTLKRLASELILNNISPKALQFIHSSQPHFTEDDTKDEEMVGSSIHNPRISRNTEAIERIKALWSQSPRPSQREIAKIIRYPASSTKYQIKMMREKGELDG